MEQRVSIQQTLPAVWKAMYGLSASVSQLSITPIQKELLMRELVCNEGYFLFVEKSLN
ncbi:hypothetical protein [Spirosoma aerolatum]|uniref:hypothetical protein n=1 Tax=Spirosoma aerolatum TaxID=1211326 RepID=UPI0015D09751|nr:hypothetical protein [Spirosoma aerolatum]